MPSSPTPDFSQKIHFILTFAPLNLNEEKRIIFESFLNNEPVIYINRNNLSQLCSHVESASRRQRFHLWFFLINGGGTYEFMFNYIKKIIMEHPEQSFSITYPLLIYEQTFLHLPKILAEGINPAKDEAHIWIAHGERASSNPEIQAFHRAMNKLNPNFSVVPFEANDTFSCLTNALRPTVQFHLLLINTQLHITRLFDPGDPESWHSFLTEKEIGYRLDNMPIADNKAVILFWLGLPEEIVNSESNALLF